MKFYRWLDLKGFLVLGMVASCGGEASESDRGTSGDSATSGGSPGAGGGGDPSGTGGLVSQDGDSFSGCTSPVDFVEGEETGFYLCSEPNIWRREVVECKDRLPQDNVVEFPQVVLDNRGGGPGQGRFEIVIDECSSNSDCPDKHTCVAEQVNAQGECIGGNLNQEEWGRHCVPGCTRDADCGADAVCLCHQEIGACQPLAEANGCNSDEDCGTGLHCLSTAGRGFACQSPDDQCQSSLDCVVNTHDCFIAAGRSARSCQYNDWYDDGGC